MGFGAWLCVYGLVASWGTYSRSVPHPLAASWGRRLSSIFGAAPHAVLRLPLTGSATVSAGGSQAIGSGAWSPDVACLFYTETMLVAAAFAHTASSGIDGGANEGGSADASGAGSGDSSADGGADGGIGGGADADGSGDGEPAASGDPAELSGIVRRASVEGSGIAAPDAVTEREGVRCIVVGVVRESDMGKQASVTWAVARVPRPVVEETAGAEQCVTGHTWGTYLS